MNKLKNTISAMNWNLRLFFTINGAQGKNKWLDAFGRAGAEFVIIAMVAWYIVSVFIDRGGDTWDMMAPVVFLGAFGLLGWGINFLLAEIVREPRPSVTHSETKLLFRPLENWKAFPSDHAMFSWFIFFTAALLNLPGFEMLLPMALWVSWGRVFAGVHYPQDILGGLAVAVVVAAGGYWLI